MTVIKGILLPADEDRDAELVEFDQSDYRNIQRLVGGFFGAFDAFNPECSIFYHDEGKLIGLPMNRKATLFTWMHHPSFREADVLVGDVLILGIADEETGDTHPVPEELIELFFNTKAYRYLVQADTSDAWSGNGVTYDNWIDAYNGALALAQRWILVKGVKVVAA